MLIETIAFAGVMFIQIIVFMLVSIGLALLLRPLFSADLRADIAAAIREAAREFKRRRYTRRQRKLISTPFD